MEEGTATLEAVRHSPEGIEGWANTHPTQFHDDTVRGEIEDEAEGFLKLASGISNGGADRTKNVAEGLAEMVHGL